MKKHTILFLLLCTSLVSLSSEWGPQQTTLLCKAFVDIGAGERCTSSLCASYDLVKAGKATLTKLGIPPARFEEVIGIGEKEYRKVYRCIIDIAFLERSDEHRKRTLLQRQKAAIEDFNTRIAEYKKKHGTYDHLDKLPVKQ